MMSFVMECGRGPIILVEDNESDAEIARRAIQRANLGHDLVVIEDGLAAAEMVLGSPLRKPCARPRVMLIDINLPGLDGIELLNRIRATRHLRELPVIIVSSSSETSDISKAYASGCNSYVTKPGDIHDLQSMYASVANYWARTNIANA
jgi:CheY-like chemotaxis protein